MNRNRGVPRAGGAKADRSSSHVLPMNDHHRFTDSDLSSDNDGQPIEVHRVPEDQLQLTPEQQNEVFTKIINAVDPNISKAGVRFDYVEGTFKPRPTLSNLAVHFEMEGIMLHLDSEEAKEQLVWMENNKDRIQDFRVASSSGGGDEEPMSPSRGGGADVGGAEEEEEVERDAPAQPVNDRALKNQFNYSERASQTNNPALRDREVCTEPPPCVDYAGQVTRWEIVDTYIDELEKQVAQRKEKEKPERKKVQDDDDDRPAAPGGALSSSSSATAPASFAQQLNAVFYSPACVAAIKTMERLVNQTADAATFFDYKYFEESHDAAHAADKNKALEKERRGIHSLGPPVHGTFLPLWRFSHEGVKKRTVTSLCFNPDHPDLFAAGFGSYEFGRSVRGMICLYSLKNATYPECAFETPSGVMSLDFHPQHAALIAVGMYDGTVAVYDVRDKSGVPLYISEDPKVKHTDPVWQVHWCTDEDVAGAASSEGKKGLNFFSVSSDGRITNWCMNKNELQHEEVVQLRLVGGVHGEGGAGAAGAGAGASAGAGAADDAASAAATAAAVAATSSDPDSTVPVDATTTTSNNANVTSLVGLAGGSCFDFNVHNRHLFIVGTEEGAIHLYSKAYNSQFVRAYVGHDMSVYAVKWNPFHPGIFLSCSADWQVKVWEVETPTPIMTFDLGCSVGDIAWSPYSSTSFSVVTSDGKLRAYDLSLHKHEPIGELKVNKKTKLTHVCYNSVEPILCVGDDRGVVTVVKLSSTLRKMGAPTIAEIDKEEEVQRLDRLLIIPTRAAEGTAQPAYLTSFLDTFRREKELVAKAKAAEKAATEASKAGAQSPLASPKGRKD